MLNIGEAISQGWNAFTRYPGLAVGGFVLYIILGSISMFIPVVNIFVTPAIAGGFIILTMNIANHRNPEIGDLFSGFQRLGPWMGVFWLYTLIALIAMIPYFIGFIPSAGKQEPSGSDMLLLFTGLGISMLLTAIAASIWGFVFFFVAEGDGTMDAFRKSAEMTSGRRLTVFLLILLLGLIYYAGAAACGIGILVSGPVVFLSFIAAYNQMKPKAVTEETGS